MGEALVSIIMPIHNGGKYMHKAIQSVLVQSYEHWELVIIDDGSEDNTFAIADRFRKSDSRITVIKNDGNQHGTNVARNIGIKAAKADYITFLDCDDYLLKDSLKLRIDCFETNDNVALVYGNALIENEHITYKCEYPVFTENRVNEHLAKELSLCSQNTIMVEKSALKKVGYLDERLKCWTDDDLVLSIGFRYGVRSCNKFVAVICKENSSMTTNKDNAYLGLKHLLNKYQTQIISYAGVKRLILWYIRLLGAYCFARERSANGSKVKKYLYHFLHEEIKSKCKPYFSSYFE